jgi:hypothetical protein
MRTTLAQHADASPDRRIIKIMSKIGYAQKKTPAGKIVTMGLTQIFKSI